MMKRNTLNGLFRLLILFDFIFYMFFSQDFKFFIDMLFVIVLTYWFVRLFVHPKHYKGSNINQVNQMEGHEFEHYVSHLYSNLGYKTYVTKASGDYGADVIAEKNGIRYAIQCKRYKKPVGIKAVQEIVGALKVYHAQKGIVITNSTYTPAAIQLAEANQIKLIDKKQLIVMIGQAHKL